MHPPHPLPPRPRTPETPSDLHLPCTAKVTTKAVITTTRHRIESERVYKASRSYMADSRCQLSPVPWNGAIGGLVGVTGPNDATSLYPVQTKKMDFPKGSIMGLLWKYETGWNGESTRYRVCVYYMPGQDRRDLALFIHTHTSYICLGFFVICCIWHYR